MAEWLAASYSSKENSVYSFGQYFGEMAEWLAASYSSKENSVYSFGQYFGEMAEWSKARDSKSRRPQKGLEGSNPSLSAMKIPSLQPPQEPVFTGNPPDVSLSRHSFLSSNTQTSRKAFFSAQWEKHRYFPQSLKSTAPNG